MTTDKLVVRCSFDNPSSGVWIPTIHVSFPEVRCLDDLRPWMARDELAASIEALSTGRTHCVQVLSEAEHRARFEAWWWEHWLDACDANRGTFNHSAAQLIWLACAKAMGAVADTGGQG